MSEVFGGKMVFPIHDTGHGAPFDEGMSLRDYFAAKAMESLVSRFLDKDLDLLDPHGWMEGLAMDSYSMADAMMKHRDSGE